METANADIDCAAGCRLQHLATFSTSINRAEPPKSCNPRGGSVGCPLRMSTRRTIHSDRRNLGGLAMIRLVTRTSTLAGICSLARASGTPALGAGTDPMRIDTGMISGQRTGADGKVRAYKGIPFAAPPVGKLRSARRSHPQAGRTSRVHPVQPNLSAGAYPRARCMR